MIKLIEIKLDFVYACWVIFIIGFVMLSMFWIGFVARNFKAIPRKNCWDGRNTDGNISPSKLFMKLDIRLDLFVSDLKWLSY